jgi:hypothetical protein
MATAKPKPKKRPAPAAKKKPAVRAKKTAAPQEYSSFTWALVVVWSALIVVFVMMVAFKYYASN